jgi:hypothetical protein
LIFIREILSLRAGPQRLQYTAGQAAGQVDGLTDTAELFDAIEWVLGD